MRIQHNISAMNAYRNFNTNNSKLTKNLEKLSTGYKINRAGDDAAGLAISEKMRAQITGLEGATKNAKDGISLIQTAEGALTEVHDMLNRMVTLTEQSANGTYDDTLDRAQLQKEVEALKSEIDRVADSTNYNGIKLLDGSLSGAGSLKGNVNLNDTRAVAAVAETAAFSAASGLKTDEDTLEYSLSYIDNNGNEQKAVVKFSISQDQQYLVSAQGDNYVAGSQSATAATTKGASVKATNFAKAVLSELQKDSKLTAAFDIELTNGSNALKFTSKIKGTGGAMITSTDARRNQKKDGKLTVTKLGAETITRKSNAEDTMQKLDLTNLKVLGKKNLIATGDVEKAVEDNTFTIDGKKFVLIGKSESYDDLKTLIGGDVTMIQMSSASAKSKFETKGANFATSSADSKKIAAELSRVTGRKFVSAAASQVKAGGASQPSFKANDIMLRGDKLSKGGKELTLQVGDTSDEWNQVGVKVADMHVDALGIRNVDISNQEGAAAAVSVIKNAVNMVSDTRGGLGALQNRLDHTINNLGVMRENIQSAEGLIRDTDVAEEMTTYTKNNILNQAAQAMLAQANQLPQGVLQLLG